MDALYFYSYEGKKQVEKVLEHDFFKRMGYTVREAKLLGSKRQGFFLHFNTTPENIKKAEDLLSELKLEKPEPREAEEIIKAIKEEAESAEAGMGAIFGKL
ncbi:MAG: hypothetical protein QXJ68_04730 [Methanocellales archaeon]